MAVGSHSWYCIFFFSKAARKITLSASRQILNSPLGLNKVSKCKTKCTFNNLWQNPLVTKSLSWRRSNAGSHQVLSNLIAWSFKSWWMHKGTKCLPVHFICCLKATHCVPAFLCLPTWEAIQKNTPRIRDKRYCLMKPDILHQSQANTNCLRWGAEPKVETYCEVTGTFTVNTLHFSFRS